MVHYEVFIRGNNRFVLSLFRNSENVMHVSVFLLVEKLKILVGS